MRALLAAFAVLAAISLVPQPSFAEGDIEKFFGSYVGSGVAERDDGSSEQRDMDVVISPVRDGFRLSWITVIRDEAGNRTGAGVKRRAVEEEFVLSEDMPGIYISAPEGGLFDTAELANPLGGDPFRWASLRDDTLTVYSAGINEDGGTEMQIYRRTLTADGLDVGFVRLADEHVKVKVDGALRRTE